MFSLYIVFLTSIAALLWAAYAITQTVRRYGRARESSVLRLREERTESLDTLADP